MLAERWIESDGDPGREPVEPTEPTDPDGGEIDSLPGEEPDRRER